MPVLSESQASFFGVTDEEKEAAAVGDRRRNTMASPEFLASLTTCCVCNQPMPKGNRYLCDGCKHPKSEVSR